MSNCYPLLWIKRNVIFLKRKSISSDFLILYPMPENLIRNLNFKHCWREISPFPFLPVKSKYLPNKSILIMPSVAIIFHVHVWESPCIFPCTSE